jgi:hypothetical protein
MILKNGSIEECFEDSKSGMIIFGTENIASAFIEKLSAENLMPTIKCFVDNNSTLWGNKISFFGNSYDVCSPEYLKKINDENIVVVIASTYVYDIFSQLNSFDNLKNNNCWAFTFINWLPDIELNNYLDNVNSLKKKYINQSEKFNKIKDSHIGERCFIIGNGPSLRMDDLDKLKNEFCFGANQIFFSFDKTEWRPKAYVTVNADSFNAYREEIDKIDCEYKFIDSKALDYQVEIKDAIYLSHGKYDKNDDLFSTDIEKYYYNGGTVTYTAMQIAVYMGFKEIFLLGVDNNYAIEKKKDGKQEMTGVQNHFYKNETDEKKKSDLYKIVDVDYLNSSFLIAKEFAANNDIKIINLTRGGKLEVFARKDLEEIVNS